jgi:hypothetical protein
MRLLDKVRFVMNQDKEMRAKERVKDPPLALVKEQTSLKVRENKETRGLFKLSKRRNLKPLVDKELVPALMPNVVLMDYARILFH